MFKKFWYLFLVLLIEGASLMAVELMGAKLLAPFYGSSLYVWTAVLSITVLGLTFGYHFGGRFAAPTKSTESVLHRTKRSSELSLAIILGFSALLVFALPTIATGVIAITKGMGLITGICTASVILIVPPMFCFGLVGPMVVRLMSQKVETIGNVAGTVYFTSTLGGIAATFLFGFYWIPELGLKLSSLITALALASLPFILLLQKKSSSKNEVELTPEPDTIQISIVNASSKSVRQKANVKQQEIKISVYLFAALEGATVMAVELIVARMLAPYFGASLYEWATVIGITLLSLALGYYLGGKLADRGAQLNSIHWALLGAAVFILCMHFSAQLLTQTFAGMDIQTSVVLVSLLLIIPPLFFLGMVPTLLIRYLTVTIDNGGAITGRVFTISSASGIVAMLLLGFFVIPAFGLTGPSIVIGLLVGMVPFVKLVMQKKYVALFFPVFLLVSLSERTSASSSPDVVIREYSEGLLGQVLVADLYKNGFGKPINDRVMFINRMGQTIIDRNTNNSTSNYAYYVVSAASKLPQHSNALVLGLGGGAVVNLLQNNLQFNVDVIELDERIVNVARKYFSLNPDVKVVVDDARHYLETTHKKYDLIIFDVFKGDVQPPHVLSLESFEKAKSLLNTNGLIITNFNGFLTNEIGKGGRSVYATMTAAGLNTRIMPTPGKEEERNTLFIAGTTNQDFHVVRSPLTLNGKQADMDSLFVNINPAPAGLNLNDVVVFTDDKSNLDRLNIKANNSWRKAYYQVYTKLFLENGVPLFN